MLYLDLSMGAAGDMLAAALLGLLPDPAGFVEKLNGLGLPGVQFTLEKSVKCGIAGLHLAVAVHGQAEGHPHDHHHDHPHDHPGGSLAAIGHLVKDHLTLPEAVARDVLAVYGALAQAESQVHGVPVEEIHFHEVGTMDAVADVTAVCLLMHTLAPGEVYASPVHVGSGRVRCAHGILPVPAPATVLLLEGIPTYGGEIQGELCTPTGAALLKHFVGGFGSQPCMAAQAVSYGMGSKDFPAANCVRAILGPAVRTGNRVLSLSCNLDDMTPEEIGFAQEQLWQAGALEVYTTAVGMKKNRPGVLLTCLCRPEDGPALTQAMFRHTTTLGIRQAKLSRVTLPRRQETAETPWGPVAVKVAGENAKAEYEDLARIARQTGLPLRQVRRDGGLP